MRLTALILLLTILSSADCNKDSVTRIPSCIREKIEAIQQQPKYNPPATVYRYTFNNQWVYLFSSNCCDQYNYLYDKNCNVICAPTGGITGKGDGKCPNFERDATDKVLVWKDPR